jgi:hypothetical protein
MLPYRKRFASARSLKLLRPLARTARPTGIAISLYIFLKLTDIDFKTA